jgi:CheY-like chemotaxis protein
MIVSHLKTIGVTALFLVACGETAYAAPEAQTCHLAELCDSQCVSNRNCQLQQDSRPCGHDISIPLVNTIHITDPGCEAAKAAQNQIYEMQKMSCEASKQGETTRCEVSCHSAADACSTLVTKGVRLDEKVILWVDDHPENNNYERQAFSELGAKVIIAVSTEEALHELQLQHVDVIISDFERVGDPKAAYTLLSEVRKKSNAPPFIIFSGSSTQQFEVEAKRRGALGETNLDKELFDLVARAVDTRKKQ